MSIGIGAFGKGLLGAQPSLGHQLEGDIGGHGFGNGGRKKRPFGITGIQNAARSQINQQGNWCSLCLNRRQSSQRAGRRDQPTPDNRLCRGFTAKPSQK